MFERSAAFTQLHFPDEVSAHSPRLGACSTLGATPHLPLYRDNGRALALVTAAAASRALDALPRENLVSVVTATCFVQLTVAFQVIGSLGVNSGGALPRQARPVALVSAKWAARALLAVALVWYAAWPSQSVYGITLLQGDPHPRRQRAILTHNSARCLPTSCLQDRLVWGWRYVYVCAASCR